MLKYKRVLLKLSGESLLGDKLYGIDPVRLSEYSSQIKEAVDLGVQLGIVIGGGNIFRVINSLALTSALKDAGVKSRVLTAIRMEPIGEFYSKDSAIQALEQGEVAIFSGGTGNPYFTTDTGSALRGIEIEADVILKGTRVDGIYSADPLKNTGATKYSEISFDEIYSRGLKIMDLTATTMCKENNMPVVVFDMDTSGNLIRVLKGEPIGTFVHN
jgi:uridylate kinase